MAVSSKEAKLESQLTCAICLDRYKDPRMLPCAHSFCKDCIDRLPVELKNGRHVVKCPACRKLILLEDGALALPVAFYINNMMEIHSDGLQKTAHHHAKPDIHVPPTSSPKTGENSRQLCHAHENKPIDLYCETCEEYICFKCSTESHRDHQCDRAEDLYAKYKQQIEACLKPVREQIDNVKQTLDRFDTREREMREQGEAVQKEIDDSYQQLMSELEESRRRLSQEAAAALQEKLHLHSLQRSNVEAVLEKLKSYCEFIEEELRSQSQYQILAAKKQLVKHINNTHSEVKVSELQPAQQPNIVFTAAIPTSTFFGNITSKQSFLCHALFSVNIPSHVMVYKEMAVNITTVLPSLAASRLSCQFVSSKSRRTKLVVFPVNSVGEGQFKVMIWSNTVGLHQLRVLVDGVDIYGSPFSVRVTEWKRQDLVRLAEDFRGPWGIAVTDDGQYLVINEMRSHCVTVLSCITGEVVKKIEGDSEFVGPCGIAVSADNRIFVAYTSGRLRVLDCSSSYEASCEVKCTGVAVHDGQVYCISDTKITVLNADDLTPSYSFFATTYDNTVDLPVSDHLCNIATDSEGVLYAIGQCVVKYKHGKHLANITNSRFKDLVGICIDSNEIVYVTDRMERKVMAFTTEGKYLGSFGRSRTSQLNPCGVAVDKTGNVYVCDYVTGEVLVSRTY